MAIDINKLAQVGSMAATGGTAQAVMGGAQALYGLTQLPKARAEFERAKAAAPSLETPAQFYENYKNAYDGEMARMQNDAIQANLATSVQALQGAGGRALVGGLNQATAQSQAAQNSMLAQERQMRLAAGQQLATAEERAIGRKEARSQQEMAYANQAYQAALGNIGSGLGSVGEGLMYSGGLGLKDSELGKNVGEKAGEFADKAAGAVQKGAGFVGDKVKEGASFLKEKAEYQMDMMPERINDFKNQRAMKKTMRQAQKRGAPVQQIAPPSYVPEIDSSVFNVDSPSLNLAPNFTQPVETNPFDLRGPMNGSAIPSEYRNDQAMKQINALSKQYQQFAPALGRMTSFKHGGMMTQGAFNHDTNPIDLVQAGQKVGEATGGEYILNPEQAAAIAKQSSFAKNLFKKFERNAKKNK